MGDRDMGKDPAEKNDLISGFDETNGVVGGLDGESDGTVNGEDYSAGDPDGQRHGFGYFLTHLGKEDRRAP